MCAEAEGSGFLDFVEGEGFFGAGVEFSDGLFFADVLVFADGSVDEACGLGGDAVAEGHVGFLDGSVFELAGESPVGLFGLGDEHDAGGVTVEAVEDAGAPAGGGWVADCGLRIGGGCGPGAGGGWWGCVFGADAAGGEGETLLVAVVDESVDEGSGPFTAGGVDDEVGLFVEGEEVLVFVEDVEGDGFGDEFVDGLGWGDHFDEVAVLGVVGGFDDASVGGDEAVTDDALDAGAGEVADAIDEVLVEASGEVFGDFPAEVDDISGGVVVGFGEEVVVERLGHGGEFGGGLGLGSRGGGRGRGEDGDVDVGDGGGVGHGEGVEGGGCWGGGGGGGGGVLDEHGLAELGEGAEACFGEGASVGGEAFVVGEGLVLGFGGVEVAEVFGDGAESEAGGGDVGGAVGEAVEDGLVAGAGGGEELIGGAFELEFGACGGRLEFGHHADEVVEVALEEEGLGEVDGVGGTGDDIRECGGGVAEDVAAALGVLFGLESVEGLEFEVCDELACAGQVGLGGHAGGFDGVFAEGPGGVGEGEDGDGDEDFVAVFVPPFRNLVDAGGEVEVFEVGFGIGCVGHGGDDGGGGWGGWMGRRGC